MKVVWGKDRRGRGSRGLAVRVGSIQKVTPEELAHSTASGG